MKHDPVGTLVLFFWVGWFVRSLWGSLVPKRFQFAVGVLICALVPLVLTLLVRYL